MAICGHDYEAEVEISLGGNLGGEAAKSLESIYPKISQNQK